MKWNYNFAVYFSLFSFAVIFIFAGTQATSSNRATTTLDPPNEKKCRVNRFIVQKNFNASLYQGHWFMTSRNKNSFFTVDHPFLSKFISIRNAEIHYKLRSDGNLRVLVGSMNFRMFCQQYETVAHVTNKTAPQKMKIQISPKIMHPYWIIHTDYTGYAVTYSCLKVQSNGMCAPDHAIISTLNRKPTGHTPAQQAKIDNIIHRLCFNPFKLNVVGYDGRCPELDPENFPQHKILMEAVCLILILVVIIIGIIYIFCCQSPPKEKRKEHKK